jgi:hypothetical protein
MKIFALLTFLLFTSLQTFAQQDADKLFFLKKSEKYRKMRNTGATLTVGGSILMVVGIVTLLNSTITTTSTYGSPGQTTTTGNPGGGFAAYLIGAAGVGAGVPLWIVGGISHGKYERKLQSLSAGVNVSPQASGLRLTYRF